MPRALGIDWGRRRVGLAISEGKIASPLVILDAKKVVVADAIAGLVRTRGIEIVVVGFPLSWDDRQNPRCEEVRAFIAKLRERLDVPVLAVDEWGTSSPDESVPEKPARGKHRGCRDAGGDDSVSAARILQSYLDTGDTLTV